jgi:hypothetical protein
VKITAVSDDGITISDGSKQSPENLKIFNDAENSNPQNPDFKSKFLTIEELKSLCHPSQSSRGSEFVFFKPNSHVCREFENATVLVGQILDFTRITDDFVTRSLYNPNLQNYYLIWIPSNGELVWSHSENVCNFKNNFDNFAVETKKNPYTWYNFQIALEELGVTGKTNHFDPHFVKIFEEKFKKSTPV